MPQNPPFSDIRWKGLVLQHPSFEGFCNHQMKVSKVMGAPPVLIRFYRIFREINHPAIGITLLLGNPQMMKWGMDYDPV